MTGENVRNAMGEPQTIVVFGGTSEIGLEIARQLISPTTRQVVLACRDTVAGDRAAATLSGEQLSISVVEFDAAEFTTHRDVVRGIVDLVGDLDVVVFAFGVLGQQRVFDTDPVAAAHAAQVNYTGAVSTGLAVAEVMRQQGHGRLVVLSSVAGERTRKANFVYGSTKAGLDGFAQGLGDDLEGSGAKVLVVRPGFVHSKMTEGMAPAPFATTPSKVAEITVAGLRQGRRTVWAPGILRYVLMVLRHLPGPVYRRLPIG
jgi:decaprenylphospho-beta-D-erythro-pentofuranosid-2-ulose 2-reductase